MDHGKYRSSMQMKESKVSAMRGQRLHLPSDLPRWACYWLLLGMWWLLVGLAASPVGDKVWNPGKPYHDSPAAAVHGAGLVVGVEAAR